MSSFNKYPLKKKIVISIAHVLLAFLAFVWLIPIFWVVLTSFRGTKGSYSSTFFPTRFTLDNYRKLFTDFSVFNFPQMLLNTFIIAVISCMISTFFVIAVAFTLSRLRFQSRRAIMNAAMVINLFPGFMSMIAVYYIFKMFGWTNGPMLRVAMIAVYAGGAGCGYHIAKGFFDTIPFALDEAALIDGVSKWNILTKIIMPLSKPIIVYTLLTSFAAPFKDFMLAKVLCGPNQKYYTVAVGLYQMLEKEYIDQWFCSFAAGAVIISIPIAFLFLRTQKYYVDGISGAVKG
ncbi:MAG TPA: ABC transporter permease subunit [Lachnospiraceae bacterium]|nr:ABC transporter permease subunit [Lachnospiraceae bacterium]